MRSHAATVAMALAGLLALLAAACGEQTARAGDGGTAVTPVPGKSIEAVLAEHTDSLMALPGVVGTAQGECAGRPCIKVLVVEDTPQLRGQLPSSLDGYAVEMLVTGEIEARD